MIQAAYDLAGAIVTKNQARQLISALEIPDKELNRLTSNIRPEYYFNIPKKLNKWFASL